MKETNKEILRYVRKARDRIHIALILEYTAKASIGAMGIYMALVILSRFIPIYNAYGKGALIACGIIMAAFLISLFKTPKNQTAAKLLDSKGLRERTLTALELLDEDSAIAIIQKHDALEHLKTLDIKKVIKIKFPMKYVMISVILAMSIIISGFIPNPMEEKSIEIFNAKKKILRQQKEIEEVIKRIEINNKLTPEQKEEVKTVLEEMKKELSKVQDVKEGLKALERTENRIEMLKEKYGYKELDKIIEEFSKNEITRDLAETLKKGDTKRLRSELQKAAEDLKNMKQDEIKELSQNLSQLAENLERNPELAETFYELAQKISSGELGDLQNEISSLNEQINKLMDNQEFSRAIEDVMESLRDAAQNQSQQGQKQQGQGKGQGRSQSETVGQGQNQDRGNDGGKSGAGAGEGTGQNNETQSSQGVAGIGNKKSSGKNVREYEKVFTPSLPGGTGEKSQLHGHKNDEGDTKEYIVDKGIGIKGEMKPYNRVIGEYREKAFQNIEGRQVPQNLEDMVKNYFTSLED